MQDFTVCTYALTLLTEGVFRRRSADGARVRRPRTGLAHLDPGGLRGSTWAPLRAPRQELADGQVAITSGVSEKRGPRTEIAAVERREARRSRWTGNLRNRRSARPRGGPRGAAAIRTSAVSALRPLTSREGKVPQTSGAPASREYGGLFARESQRQRLLPVRRSIAMQASQFCQLLLCWMAARASEVFMPDYDLSIRGGTIVTASDTFRADVGVRAGRIVAVADRIEAAAREIDASGLLVMPGGIDSHVHLAQPAFGGPKMADDFLTGTRSAIAGGNTTVLPFALQ